MLSLDTAAGSARVHVGLNASSQVTATQSDTSNTNASANTTTQANATNTWYHLGGGFTSNTSRTAYLNGAAGSANTTSITFTAPDTVRVGARVASSAVGNYADGRICQLGVWNVVLSADEWLALAAGASPLSIRPENLVAYIPLLEDGDACDWVGGGVLTPTNAPTRADHQAIILPFKPRIILPASGPTISSVTDSNKLIDEQALTITGTNFGGLSAVTLRQTGRPDFDATSYVSTSDATTIELGAIDVQDTQIAYGSAELVVTASAGTSSAFAITVAKKASQKYITLSGHTAGTGWAFGLSSANSDQLGADNVTAKGGTFSFVGTDGAYTIDYPDPQNVPAGDTITRLWYDDSADLWAEDVVRVTPGGDEYPLLRHQQLRQARAGRVVSFGRRGGARR